VQVSEVIWEQDTAEAVTVSDAIPTNYLPLNTNILPYLQSQAFGVERRVLLPTGNTFMCLAGTAAAGVYFRSDSVWKGSPNMELELVVRGAGSFQLAIADASRVQREAPLLLGDFVATDKKETRIRFALPKNEDPWVAISIICPSDTAELVLDGITLHHPLTTTVTTRSAWLWSPRLWMDAPQEIWKLAREENLSKVFLTIPMSETGDIANTEQLAVFISQSKALNLDVWAVIGDPRDVLPENLAPLQDRVSAYIAYNVQHADAEQIAGLQLDIEPYLIPGYSLAPGLWRDRYVQTVKSAHEILAGNMPLELVIPVWWGTHPQLGSLLLSQLVWPALQLNVMNYRTASENLRTGALPFLAWGQENNIAISMALELGSIGENETRLTFVTEADDAQLWLVVLGDYRLFLLLSGNHPEMQGVGYTQVADRIIDNANVTFSGELENLHAVADAMAKEWSAWASFSGIAIHGLEELQIKASE